LLRTARYAVRTLLIAAVAGALVLACSDDEKRTTAPDDTLPADAAPEFSLPDVNEASATAGEDVSPRDHLDQVSAWYFGHAT
jgi:hypothetical protein